jgi:hypothetical protein
MNTDERDEMRWELCHRLEGCVHRHGHGGACLPWQEVTVAPVDVYAYAIKAGLDALAEIQQGRS